MPNEVTATNELNVGDLVVSRNGSPVVYRIESIADRGGLAGGWAHFIPVRRDGQRDNRRTPFSGSLQGFLKVA